MIDPIDYTLIKRLPGEFIMTDSYLQVSRNMEILGIVFNKPKINTIEDFRQGIDRFAEKREPDWKES